MLGETSDAEQHALANAQEAIASIIGRQVIASVGSGQTFYAGLSGKVVSASLKLGKSHAEIEVSVQSNKDTIVVPLSSLSLPPPTDDCVEAYGTLNLSGYIGCKGLYKPRVRCLVVGLVLQEEKAKALVLMEQEGNLENGDWDTVVAEGFELSCNYSEWTQASAFFFSSDQL